MLKRIKAVVNELSSIQDVIYQLPSLELLDFSFNRIQSLTLTSFRVSYSLTPVLPDEIFPYYSVHQTIRTNFDVQ